MATCRRVEGPGLMLLELSVVEQRYHAVLEVLEARLPVIEVAAPVRGVPQIGARLAAPLRAVRAGRLGRPVTPAAPPAASGTGRGGGGDLPAAHRASEVGAASAGV